MSSQKNNHLRADITLDYKYSATNDEVYLTGTQALAKLLLLQRQQDKRSGINTAGFVSGYRGSPLAGLDKVIEDAHQFMEKEHIYFQPGVNEELGATAVWGSQQIDVFGQSKYDGVFGMWYGKGPGIDRSGDVLKHGNFTGTSQNGGVLVLAGDDHICESSTLPHQSEHALIAAAMPILNPAGVQEFIDLGLYGWALSRYSGCWVGFKTVTETVNSSGTVDVSPEHLKIITPKDFKFPKDGVYFRWPDSPLDQEERHFRYKLNAAVAFARANKLDKMIIDSPKARIGIITTGKSYLDVRQALHDLGLDRQQAAEIGIRLYKVALTWPLEPEGVRSFVDGLEEIIIVEEKRSVIETQLKEQLYNIIASKRPRVIGKYDIEGNWILPEYDEITPAMISQVVAERIKKVHNSDTIEKRLKFIENKHKDLKAYTPPIIRTPYYCSGCPHNTSTVVPKGSQAMGGIGCHIMAAWLMPERNTKTFTQMGGEGVPWIGAAPFSKEKHIFVNLGDGTYYHSGYMAIRAAVAAEINITYKILYNDAVAMTGGQHVDGPLDVPQITRQMKAEGVKKIIVVTDEPKKYGSKCDFAEGVKIFDRSELETVQSKLRDVKGVSVLIYDQTCAAEKRRRRKRGLMEDPPKRIFIHDLVCEGCGDCSKKSNCVSILPLETELGTKRAIDQSTCNKDYSCVNGFCPSFVNVIDGNLKKQSQIQNHGVEFDTLPEPKKPSLKKPYGILITGIGGTGVVTIGALLGMAGYLEKKGISTLEMTGLAQKGGSVISHVRIAKEQKQLHAVRIAAGGANLVLACDMMVATSFDALTKVAKNKTHAIINTKQTITGVFTQSPDFEIPEKQLKKNLTSFIGIDNCDFVEASEIATALFGDSIATNLFMLGYAYQKGFIPLHSASIEKAIELNAVAVEMNKKAFLWGRRAAYCLEKVKDVAFPRQRSNIFNRSLEEQIQYRYEFLVKYQNQKYAKKYLSLVDIVKQKEAKISLKDKKLTEAVARYAFKLMAYKDEYEVARLYSEDSFQDKLNQTFEGDYKLELNLAPPLLSRKDPVTGELKKKTYGPWVFKVFKFIQKMKFLRGTVFDIFGYTHERKMERKLIKQYFSDIQKVTKKLDEKNKKNIVTFARLPEFVRGFGHVKEKSIVTFKKERKKLLAKL